ncbi:DUF2779 domain-containing protein [Flaviaesturariibacter aridisoli]|uniref:DUF2779 domain-containing protein n=1 Tax=Flaviaesturariibacter aridisoli TaxID=2545761 RepID=A0A4V2WNC1_9BACT|nr:DUF2779 domain-containing protein [Flaviaesturariibacter aridisoli]TCZ74912.1 DUF2779 domain-containing protein [Flaviaesturariibacter aridisoli]
MAKQQTTQPLTPLITPADSFLRALAHQRYPGGMTVSHEEGDLAAARETVRLLKEGHTILYDACVAQEGMLAVLDVLVQRRGKWVGLLLRPSTRPKEKHFLDAVLMGQLWADAGYPLDETVLLLLNSQYIRRGGLDPEGLFAEERLRRIRFGPAEVRGRMQMLKRMAAKGRERAARGMPAKTSSSYASAPPPATEGPVEIQVDAEPLQAFVRAIGYPRFFMDFESYQVAIPEWDGHWPFRQLPFQFSVHRQEAPGAPVEHINFIAEGADEPVAAFGKALLDAVGTEGPVLVYNRDSEQLILDQLERDHPQWSGALEALRQRLVDIQAPFVAGWVRIPANGNKLSLKYVLPALVPDMNYTALNIADGEEAHLAYNRLRQSKDEAQVAQIREDLAAYCAVDTLAMVKILERLEQLA